LGGIQESLITIYVWNYLSGLEDNESFPEDIILVRVKEQPSMYRPEEILRVPGG